MSSKKKKKEEKNWKAIAIIYFIMSILFAIGLYWQEYRIDDLESSQLVPRDLGGSVHDGKSIYVRIDMSQPGSLAVYKNLQQNCLKLNIRSCMSAEDLLNLKK